MPSNLTSGNGLDGVVMGNFSPYRAPTIHTALAVASSPSFATDTKDLSTFTKTDTKITNLIVATEENTTQHVQVQPNPLSNLAAFAAPNDYVLGIEVSQGDRIAAERGDLNSITSMYEVVATGYNQLRNGNFVGPDGTVLTAKSYFGSSISLGSDNASGRAVRFTTNYGTVSGATTSNFSPST